MRPEGEDGASHVMWTESFAWGENKTKHTKEFGVLWFSQGIWGKNSI